MRSVRIRGKRRWRVDTNLGGRRVCKNFKTKAEAEAEIQNLNLQRANSGDAWLTLSPAERTEVMMIGRRCRRPACRSGRSETTGAKARAPSSRATRVNRLSTLFAFLKRRRLVRENPCEFIDRPTIEQGPPAILSVEQCRKALKWSRKHETRFLAWLVLGLFAGVRPNELDRLKWDDVDIEGKVVRIDAAASKVRQRRIVHLEPAALAWLVVAKKANADLPLPHVTRRRYLRALRTKLGFEDWPKDVLRHTAASNLVALKKDAAAVALELGNSPQILLKHYRELVTAEQAAAFWNLMPRQRAHPQEKK